MKILRLLLLSLSFCLFACKHEPAPPTTKECTLVATGPAMIGLDEFTWRQGDVISVYATDGRFYDFTLVSPADNQFIRTLPIDVEITSFAVFPPVPTNARNLISSDGKLALELARKIDSKEIRADFPMIATFEEGANELTFRPLAALLQFTVASAPGSFDAELTFQGSDPVGRFLVDPSVPDARLEASAISEESILRVHCVAEADTCVFCVPVATGSWDSVHIKLLVENQVIYENDRTPDEGTSFVLDCGGIQAVPPVIATPSVFGELSVPMTALPKGCVFQVVTEYGVVAKEVYEGEKEGAYTFTASVPLEVEKANLSLGLPDGRPLFSWNIQGDLASMTEGSSLMMEPVDAVLAEIAFVEERYGGENSISFMQISDTHKRDISINKLVELVKNTDVPFSVITGDMYFSNLQVHTILSADKPIYIIPGNHDIFDYYGGWRAAGLYPYEPNYCFRWEQMDKWFGSRLKANSHYGSEKACYFYNDFKVGDKTLRIIGLDQYDGGTAGWGDGTNNNIMSQEEADWLVGLLEQSDDVDGILFIMHAGFGGVSKGRRNTDNKGEFISTTSGDYTRVYGYYGDGDPYLVPEIVQAYLSGKNLDKKEFLSGATHRDDGSDVPPETTLTVTTHFTKPHDNFIGYIGGHMHWDMVEYLEDFPQQLQILIANGFSERVYSWHDLTYADTNYTINYYVVNFDTKTLVIHRIGSRLTTAGTYRLEQLFPLGQ